MADRFLKCVRSNFRNFLRKSPTVHIFQFLIVNSFISIMADNLLHSHRIFGQIKFFSRSQHISFQEVTLWGRPKFLWRVMWHVSYDMSIKWTNYRVQKVENRPRNARVIIENKVVRFNGYGVVYKMFVSRINFRRSLSLFMSLFSVIFLLWTLCIWQSTDVHCICVISYVTECVSV